MNLLMALGLVALVIIGSIVWIRPSPRDKKLANWRRDALVAGLKVKLEGFRAEPKESGIRDDLTGASYQLFNMSPDKKDTTSWAVVSSEDGWLKDDLPEGWCWYKQEANAVLKAKIADAITRSPCTIIGLERTPYMSRIVWQENGKEFDVQALKSFLQHVQNIA